MNQSPKSQSGGPASLIFQPPIQRLEWLLLVIILVVSFGIRLYRLGDFPDTVLGDEADNVQSSLRILYGLVPDNGFFGVDWTQQPAFSAYKEAAFIALFGFNVAALRLSSALITTLALIPFYLLLRRQLSMLASLIATVLFSTTVWYLNFSRSGWNCADVGFYMLLAMLALMLALDSLDLADRRPWQTWIYFAAAGFFCALGLYGYPAGRAISLAAAAFLPGALLFYRRQRRTVLLGFLLMFAVEGLVFAPEGIYALRNWGRFNGRTGVVLIFNDPAYRADPVGTMMLQLSNNLRGPWDGQVNNTPQYSPPGEPQLDRFTGMLALAGMILTFALAKLRGRPETWLWWLMLLCGWAMTQLLTARTPNGARGIGYMPTLVYFAGVGLDGLVTAFQSLSTSYGWSLGTSRWSAAALVVVALSVGSANVVHYVDWQSNPKTRGSRYIYVTTREFPLWAADITHRAMTNGNVTNLNEWRALYPIADPSHPYGGAE